jgi:translation initiation factor IF-2
MVTRYVIYDLLSIKADVMNLQAQMDVPVEGTVLEAKINKGLGVVTSVIVQQGVLQTGTYVVAGTSWGKVRNILNDQGKQISEALPSSPVQVDSMITACSIWNF